MLFDFITIQKKKKVKTSKTHEQTRKFNHTTTGTSTEAQAQATTSIHSISLSFAYTNTEHRSHAYYTRYKAAFNATNGEKESDEWMRSQLKKLKVIDSSPLCHLFFCVFLFLIANSKTMHWNAKLLNGPSSWPIDAWSDDIR